MCLCAALLGPIIQTTAEPLWLCPSYQIVEVARLHEPVNYPSDSTTEKTPLAIGLGANSQVVYETFPPSGGAFGERFRLWQPEVQFGRPAGTSMLWEGGSVLLYGPGPMGTGVTSDGRFTSLELGTYWGAGLATQLRWWDGYQWISRVDEALVDGRLRSPYSVHGVNERGDIAFEYVLYEGLAVPDGPPATSVSRAGLWSGAVNAWQPIFPEATTRAYVLSMNANGVCCGVYRAANAPPATTPFRGFTATYGTTPIDFGPVGSLGGYSQTHGINDAGEMVGVTGTQFGGVRPFIYLPAAAHGLSSGLHDIGPTMVGYTGSSNTPLSVTARIFINNRGQALLTPSASSFGTSGTTNGFLWQRGQSWPLAQLADTSGYQNRQSGDNPWNAEPGTDPQNTGWLALHAPRGFNDRGEILIHPVVASYVSVYEYDTVLLLFRPKLVASIALDREKSAPGATNQVRLRLQNAFTATLTSPGTPVLHWDGAGTPNILSGPTLTSTNPWSPGVSNEWVWTIRFTNETTGTWVAQGSAGGVNSTLGESALLKVLDQADLWVRRTTDVAWKGNDTYFEEPLAAQTRETPIQPTETAAFNVRVQNDSERSRELTVKAVASGDPGWQVTYQQGAADVSALITGAGLNVGTLTSGAYVDLTVTLRGTNALDSGSRREIVFTGKALGATNGSDVVKVAAEVLNEIIVNSTGDEPDASLTDGVPDVNTNLPGLQTTLRCAIDFANRRAGANLIKFAIPANDPNWVDGVPQIEPATALPEITKTVVIAGWSQNTNASTPPIALSGKRLPRPPRPASPYNLHFWPGASPALVLKGEACELRGLVINQFPTGLELAGAGSHVVEGCIFGLNAAGDSPLGNGLDGYGWREHLQDPDAPYPSQTSAQRARLRSRGWDVRVTSPQNRLGGSSARQRNRHGSVGHFVGGVSEAGSRTTGFDLVVAPPAVWVDGQTAFANTIIGCSFGIAADESTELIPPSESGNLTFTYMSSTGSQITNDAAYAYYRTDEAAILVTDAPGTLIGNATGGGNLFTTSGVELSGANCIGTTFFGNFFGVSRDGGRAFRRLVNGLQAVNCGFVQIGGLNVGEANRFVPERRAISLVDLVGQTSRILGNMIGHTGTANCNSPDALVGIASTAQTEVRGNTFSGYRVSALSIFSENNTPPAGTVSVLNNTFIHSRDVTVNTPGVPISITSGRGHTAIGNQFTGPADERMLVLGSPLSFNSPIPPLPNDDFDLDGGPNNQQNWPVVATALLTNGQLLVQAGVDTGILSGEYSLHVYRCFADQWHHGQPQELVAAGIGSADASGRAAFIATVPVGTVAEGDFLCATATGPDGSTSEVGPVRRVVGGPDAEADGMSNATENRTPTRYSPISFGDGNGDDIPDAQQANVTSLPVAANQWLTLAAPAGVSFSNVDSTVLPSPTTAPVGFAFPLGFVSFTLRGFTPGNTVAVTNLFHSAVTISNVFAFGPTPGNAQPHWYQLNFTRSGDELQLSFTDGATGDHDLTVNGSITTLYAPAYPLPLVPQLTLLSTRSEIATLVLPYDTGTNSIFVTNAMTSMRCTLGWPAGATNYLVESTSGLLPANWSPLTEGAVIIGDKLVVTHVSVTPMRFYRLRQGFVTLAPVPAPTLSIQRTSTNTFLLSWPASFAGFALQQNTNPATGNWGAVTNSTLVTNGQNQVLVAPAAGSRCFRLRSP